MTKLQNLQPTKGVTVMAHCLNCKTRKARIGKKEGGYPVDLYCSMRCAFREGLERHMDEPICKTCGDWLRICAHEETGANDEQGG